MAKGISGSFRANSLTASDLQAMENHELRLDHSGHRRSVRKDDQGDPIPPLIYNPLRMNRLTQAHAAHIDGARVNKGAGKISRHAFIQFPTYLSITPETEQMMLDQAVAFVNKTHGGNAVFWARLDRDEEGQHGVDVFFAPKYQKATKRGTATWISLTKFGKERAIERFGQRQDERKNPKTDKFEKVFDKNGDPVMVDCDSQYYQGRAFQDLWFEHLRDEVGLIGIERGTPKIGRDPDRLEVEEYKLAQDRHKLNDFSNTLEDEYELHEKLEADLERRENELQIREEALQHREADFEESQQWLDRATKNLDSAVQEVMAGKHDREITAADMPDQPVQFKTLCKAAPQGRPTWGFRCRFWSLHYSNNGEPVSEKHMSQTVRETLTRAFDRVAAWSKEVTAKRAEMKAEAERLTAEVLSKAQARAKSIVRDAESASEAHITAAEGEGARIMKDAVQRAAQALSASKQVQTAVAQVVEFKSAAREVLGEAVYGEVQARFDAAWRTHPDNVNRHPVRGPWAGPSNNGPS